MKLKPLLALPSAGDTVSVMTLPVVGVNDTAIGSAALLWKVMLTLLFGLPGFDGNWSTFSAVAVRTNCCVIICKSRTAKKLKSLQPPSRLQG